MSVPKIAHFLPAVYYTKTLRIFWTKFEIFFWNFQNNFDIYFLKSMSGNMGIHTVSQKNTFWSICISAQISFLRFYGVTSTDKSKFQPNYSIPYAIRFQKMWILWVVQFITEEPLPNELWGLCTNHVDRIWGICDPPPPS